jgi:hypothetical protein
VWIKPVTITSSPKTFVDDIGFYLSGPSESSEHASGYLSILPDESCVRFDETFPCRPFTPGTQSSASTGFHDVLGRIVQTTPLLENWLSGP